MSFEKLLLQDATAQGAGAVVETKPKGLGQTIQAWLSNAATETSGTATVDVEASNDPRAASAPSTAAWVKLATIALDAGGDVSEAFHAEGGFLYLRGNVTAIANDAAVTLKLVEKL